MSSFLTAQFVEKKVTSRIMICFSFFLPISTSATSILAILMFISWFLEADFRNKFREIFQNKFVLTVIIYFLLFVLGLLWTENFEWGLHLVRKQWKFLLLPIMLTSVRKEHIKYYLGAFIISMLISSLASFLIWQGIYTSRHGSPIDPTPFIGRIGYNPFLAISIFILLEISLYRCSSGRQKIACVSIAMLMTFSMFITQGRTGQIAFLVLAVLSFFQFYKKKILTAAIISTAFVLLFSLGAYKISPNFESRINQTAVNIQDFASRPKTSMGQRLTFLINTWEIVKSNPLAGVGTGDFPSEYKSINMKKSPAFPNTVDPHNHYLLVAAIFGLPGLAVFMTMFYLQLKFSMATEDGLGRIRIGLITFFLTIMLSGSYLIHHDTTFLYILFSSVLFKTPIIKT